MSSKKRKHRHHMVKADGRVEPYSRKKLALSLKRSGATDATVRDVLRAVEDRLEDGMTTRALHRYAHDQLRRVERPAAARYSLRRAVQALGPSGYPFERLVASLLEAEGYETSVDRMVEGRCVRHEVDVVAKRNDERVYVECKFHFQPGYRTDVKVALYVKARSVDIAENPTNRLTAFWLVTNTKFTSEATAYATCAGLRLVGWAQPDGEGLEELLQKNKIIPITCLTSLRATARHRLLDLGIVTTRALLAQPETLAEAGLRDTEAHRVLTEAERIHDGHLVTGGDRREG